jgi:hypothetical protein
MTLAIDFGTSNTVVARWNAATQQPETIACAITVGYCFGGKTWCHYFSAITFVRWLLCS